MYNVLMKEFRLGGNVFFYALPFLTGALMLIPSWLYFLVVLYFCFITVPNMFGGYKSQNDLLFTSMLPVSKKVMVKARVLFIVSLELLHIVIAMIYGMINVRLYPDVKYLFFGPTLGFWGLCFVMMAIFNIVLIPMYYKTAYKYGWATIAATTAAVLFAAGAEWLGLQNTFVRDLFKGDGADHLAVQLAICIAGMVIFAIFTIIAYYVAHKRFERVEM